jgi:LmbE family N-acetylglucosaminyl deacetylase
MMVPTLMAVHAHPDDESTSTGGILARYALEGVRTVVVTCTNGDFGDGPGGIKPGSPGHDPSAVAATRLSELDIACSRLGVSDLELLGYHDSGMVDWDFRQRADVFCNVPVETAAARVARLIEHYRPQVVVTYDPDGTYQHPDHVHAARVAALAVETTDIPARLYFKANGTSYWKLMREALAEMGIHRPAPDATVLEQVEQRITTTVDVHQVVDRKRAGLFAHTSQLGSSLAAKLSPEAFARVFGTETYIRVRDTTGSALPEVSLFTGMP